MFAKQGTPLYKAMISFSNIEEVPTLKTVIDDYVSEAKETKELGFKADKFKEKKDVNIYFKSLRALQNRHDKLIGLSTRILYEAIKSDDYKEFKNMISLGISYYEKKPKMRENILKYYKKNRKIFKINSLEKILRDDRSIVKHYDETEYVFSEDFQAQEPYRADKKIILLSMNGCGWCDKVKALLDSNAKQYQELNIENFEGARLYRKYNGSGVPITIVGDKVIRGYNPVKILKEIQ
ncbi:MAG: glutaredoxin domain-containing protein [Campylobacterota bacterium]